MILHNNLLLSLCFFLILKVMGLDGSVYLTLFSILLLGMCFVLVININ